ncbi:hypothetical protein RND71_042852 [Anisodus tanguticus]|uniref:Major facilitator superfamily (MFS) profile domain-containing protein n=1 Tax=Anisodus tanguticus TaxID=243964 RepID=A0AAE1UV24_9SOLA|nr:hypothetical protein RND71_042852 [Anisodus tanguticus]
MFTSYLYLAALVASWAASSVTRIMGRKLSMLSGGLIFLCGNVAMLIISRVLLGFGIGFANQTIEFDDTASLMSAVITGIVNFVATFISLLTADRVGRRALFLGGGVQMLISQIVIAIAVALKFGISGDPGALPIWYASFVVVFICIYVAGFAYSWGPLGWLVPNEISPLEARPTGQAVNVSFNMIFTFFIVEVFTKMLCVFKFEFFIFFGVFVSIMTLFIYKFLHWYWKRYVNQKDDEKLEHIRMDDKQV